MNIEITQKQAELILQFADTTVKAYGLQVAEQALEIKNILDIAFAKTQETNVDTSK